MKPHVFQAKSVFLFLEENVPVTRKRNTQYRPRPPGHPGLADMSALLFTTNPSPVLFHTVFKIK